MDVRCPACNVEYEFDDAKVTAAGVTVKCTNCTHIFKVRTDAGTGATKKPITEDIEWVVRCHDGRSLRFRELTTLQKWIVERKVSRNDEISRSGRNWKRLSEIAELSAFFQVVEAADNARRMGRQETNPTPVNLPEQAPPTLGPGGKPTLETFFDPDQLDDDDPVRAYKRSGLASKLVLFVLVTLVGAAAVVYFVRPDLAAVAMARLQGTAAPGERALTLAQTALTKDDAAEAKTLLEQLAPKAAQSDADASTIAAVSRLNTQIARHLSAQIAAAPAPDPALVERRNDAQKRAYKSSVRALAAPGNRAQAQLASADYQAYRAAISEMESNLAAAEKNAAPGVARSELQKEADIVRALGLTARAIAAPAADGEALAQAEAAIARAGARVMEDARLAFALLQIRSKKQGGTGALAGLDAFVTAHPQHLAARALLARHGTDAAPTDAPGGENKASAPDDATKKTDDDAASAASAGDKDADTKPDEKKDDGDDEKETASYSTLVKRADRLRLSDRARSAVSLYKKAAKLRPSSAAPQLGLGWSYLDLDRLSSAIRAFRKAVSLKGNAAQGYMGLGEVYRARGDAEKAISAFKSYLAIRPTGRDADTARRAIKSLQ